MDAPLLRTVGAVVEGIIYVLQNNLPDYITEANASGRIKGNNLELTPPELREIQALDLREIPIESYPAIRVIPETEDKEPTATNGDGEALCRIIVRTYYLTDATMREDLPNDRLPFQGDSGTALFLIAEAFAQAVIACILEKLPGAIVAGEKVAGYSVQNVRTRFIGGGSVPELSGVLLPIDTHLEVWQEQRYRHGR